MLSEKLASDVAEVTSTKLAKSKLKWLSKKLTKSALLASLLGGTALTANLKDTSDNQNYVDNKTILPEDSSTPPLKIHRNINKIYPGVAVPASLPQLQENVYREDPQVHLDQKMYSPKKRYGYGMSVGEVHDALMDLYNKNLPEVNQEGGYNGKGTSLDNVIIDNTYHPEWNGATTTHFPTSYIDNPISKIKINIPIEDAFKELNNPDDFYKSIGHATLMHEAAHADRNNPFREESLVKLHPELDPGKDRSTTDRVNTVLGTIQDRWLKNNKKYNISGIEDLRDYPGNSMDELRATYYEVLSLLRNNPLRLLYSPSLRNYTLHRALYYPTMTSKWVRDAYWKALAAKNENDRKKAVEEGQQYLQRMAYPLLGEVK